MPALLDRIRQGEDISADIAELLRVSLVILRRATQLVDLFFHTIDAVRRDRMVGEEFRQLLARILRQDTFKKLGHGARVVAGIEEYLRAQNARLTFRCPRILQEDRARSEAAANF